ncbi:MAG TPA: hypothetical protein VFB17_06650 [Gaiellaceae bacterium]|nr:hypothetical protein [Gaiellaceae bacterium]
MHHICAPKRLLTGLLALVVASLLVQAAAAASPRVIPYLSHGIGVDNKQYRYQDGEWIRRSVKSPLVIPYLSHGVGVDQSLYSSRSHELRRTTAVAPTHKAVPDAFERAAARMEAARSTSVRPDDRAGLRGIGDNGSNGSSVSTSSSSNDWHTAFVAAGGLLALLLLVGATVALARRQPKRLATR